MTCRVCEIRIDRKFGGNRVEKCHEEIIKTKARDEVFVTVTREMD